MLALNMVIIASMIGAGGLGFDVLAALRRRRNRRRPRGRGRDRAAGDRARPPVAGFASRPPPVHAEAEPGFLRRHPYLSPPWPPRPLADRRVRAGRPDLAPGLADHHRRRSVNAAWSGSTSTSSTRSRPSRPGCCSTSWCRCKRLLLSLPWLAVVAAAGLAGWQQGGRGSAPDRGLRLLHRGQRQLGRRPWRPSISAAFRP